MIKKLKILTGLGLVAAMSFIWAGTASAADLNYNANTSITIGAYTYTILLNSAATSLNVGANSITLTVAAGDTFTLRSADRFDFNINHESSKVSETCLADSNDIKILGLETITITPDTATICSTTSGGDAGGGGGGAKKTAPSTVSQSSVSPTSRGFTNLQSLGLKEGDVISAAGAGDPDIYIVNDYGYMRLFLNPAIFNFYGHLGGFSKVKGVAATTRDKMVPSGLYRNCETNDQKVYGLETTGEDTGILHWVNTTGAQAVADDPNFFKKVFCINSKEENWYTKGTPYTSVSQIPLYSR